MCRDRECWLQVIQKFVFQRRGSGLCQGAADGRAVGQATLPPASFDFVSSLNWFHKPGEQSYLSFFFARNTKSGKQVFSIY